MRISDTYSTPTRYKLTFNQQSSLSPTTSVKQRFASYLLLGKTCIFVQKYFHLSNISFQWQVKLEKSWLLLFIKWKVTTVYLYEFLHTTFHHRCWHLLWQKPIGIIKEIVLLCASMINFTLLGIAKLDIGRIRCLFHLWKNLIFSSMCWFFQLHHTKSVLCFCSTHVVSKLSKSDCFLKNV